LKKNETLPDRIFLVSIKTEPDLILEYQIISFPFPFPILRPCGFLVRGKNGNVLNHKNLLVFSLLLFSFLKNNFNLKIFLE
jgi:hypothetical protein